MAQSITCTPLLTPRPMWNFTELPNLPCYNHLTDGIRRYQLQDKGLSQRYETATILCNYIPFDSFQLSHLPPYSKTCLHSTLHLELRKLMGAVAFRQRKSLHISDNLSRLPRSEASFSVEQRRSAQLCLVNEEIRVEEHL